MNTNQFSLAYHLLAWHEAEQDARKGIPGAGMVALANWGAVHATDIKRRTTADIPSIFE